MLSSDPQLTNSDTGGAARRPLVLSEILKPDANNFGLIRLGLAFAVLVSHAFYFRTGTPKSEPLTAWTGHSLGEHAVQVFFFLSGLLVAQSLAHSRGLADFATARALRIFPGLFVCVLLTALVLGPAFTAHGLVAYLADPGTYAYIGAPCRCPPDWHPCRACSRRYRRRAPSTCRCGR